MKKFFAAMLTLVGVFAVVNASYADTRRTRDPGVNARQHNQRDRIQQGAKSGELTRRETGKLVHEQRDVRQLEREYKSDGTLTGAERRDLHQEQNEASRHIYNQKHDDAGPAAGGRARSGRESAPGEPDRTHRAGREVRRADERRSAGAAHRAARHPPARAHVQGRRRADARRAPGPAPAAQPAEPGNLRREARRSVRCRERKSGETQQRSKLFSLAAMLHC